MEQTVKKMVYDVDDIKEVLECIDKLKIEGVANFNFALRAYGLLNSKGEPQEYQMQIPTEPAEMPTIPMEMPQEPEYKEIH